VVAQLEAAARAGLRSLVCVGEGLEVREGGGAEAHVMAQLAGVLSASAPALAALGAIAYEPIWAIGTGRTATPALAQAMHRALRETLEAAGLGGLPLLYGGSVKPENAKALLSQPDIDGVLVGGASLDITAFNAIARAANE
jgi:triosephosphate isomerase